MNLIQIFLILGTALGMWIYFSYFKSVTRNRAFLLFLGFVGGYLIFRPNDLSLVAHWVGVGRGTDLLFYLSLVMGFFAILSLNAKIALLEKDRTHLAREFAILEQRVRKIEDC